MNRRAFMALGSTLWVPTPERVRVYSFPAAPALWGPWTEDQWYEAFMRTTVRVTL